MYLENLLTPLLTILCSFTLLSMLLLLKHHLVPLLQILINNLNLPFNPLNLFLGSFHIKSSPNFLLDTLDLFLDSLKLATQSLDILEDFISYRYELLINQVLFSKFHDYSLKDFVRCTLEKVVLYVFCVSVLGDRLRKLAANS